MGNTWPVSVKIEFRAVVEIVTCDTGLAASLFESDSHLGQRLLDITGLDQFHVSVTRAVAILTAVAQKM
jgi:hypothetical protein